MPKPNKPDESNSTFGKSHKAIRPKTREELEKIPPKDNRSAGSQTNQ